MSIRLVIAAALVAAGAAGLCAPLVDSRWQCTGGGSARALVAGDFNRWHPPIIAIDHILVRMPRWREVHPVGLPAGQTV